MESDSRRSLSIAVWIAVTAIGLGSSASPQVNLRAVTQSHSPASPLIAGYSAADVLSINAPLAPTPFEWRAADLGLLASMDVDAFSDGSDIFPSPGPAVGGPINCRAHLVVQFTVDTSSSGGPSGAIVAPECLDDGCASDVFEARFMPPAATGYFHVSDALGVSPLPLETDLDALGWVQRSSYPVYFTLDPASAAVFGVSPADVLVQATPGAVPTVLFSEAVLGLVPGDDIDALAVREILPCTPPPIADGNVVFSLSRTSPSAGLFGVTEAGLFEPFAGGLRAWAFDFQLDLGGPTDNLNGVRITDPNEGDVLGSTQGNPITGHPHESLSIDGSTGDAAHIVELAAGTSFTFGVAPLDPGDVTVVYLFPGRPCDADAFFFPPIGGSLAFVPLINALVVAGPSSVPGVTIGAPGEVSVQGIVITGGGAVESTNLLTVRASCP